MKRIQRITESELRSMIAESIKKAFLNENRESKNINLARKFLVSKGYSLETSQQIIDAVRTDIPNSRLMACNYLLGVTRLYIQGELNNQRTISDLNKDLKYIASDAHAKEYDSNLNDMSAQDIHDRFKENINDDFFANKEKSDKRVLQGNPDYTIVRIPDFETSSQYGKYTSWCVTHDESMYNSYTHDCSGLFYFCLRKDYKQVKPIEGKGCPLDNYGLSMIAVSVDQQGEMNTITCRWNHDNGGNDTIMNVDELENLLGVNFYKTFKPRSKEELMASGKWISEKIGTLYDDGRIRGIVASVDKNDNPHLIMALDGPTETMTWDKAMEYGKALRNGWHIPTKEELKEVWHGNREITKILNRGLKKYGGVLLGNYYTYWSSSEYSNNDAYLVFTDYGNVIYSDKDGYRYVRPFALLS